MENYTLQLKEMQTKYNESTRQCQVSEALCQTAEAKYLESEAQLRASEEKIQKLTEEQLEIQRQIEELATLVKVYDERLRLGGHGKYGASSRKNKDKNKNKEDAQQLLLFDVDAI